jgi:uncharacterized protein DUF6292
MGNGREMATSEAPVRRANHSAYIAAVRGELEARDVSTGDIRIDVSPEGRREATLRLEPDDSMLTGQVAVEASLSWDEEYGWSLLARYDVVPPVAGSPVYQGFGVLPDPDDVASWVVAVLTRPDTTPSREDGPYRDCSAADPVFEAQLGRYSTAR